MKLTAAISSLLISGSSAFCPSGAAGRGKIYSSTSPTTRLQVSSGSILKTTNELLPSIVHEKSDPVVLELGDKGDEAASDSDPTAATQLQTTASQPAVETKPRSGRAALPGWARQLNDSIGMKLITHADKKHVHAISGTAWYVGGYGLLATAWARELFANDWTTFSHFEGMLPVACLGALACSLGSFPLRHDKAFPRYGDMMKNGAVTGVLTTLLAATYSVDSSLLLDNPALMTVSQGVVAVSLLALTQMAIVDRMPWDIPDLIRELKLEMPPVWVLRFGRVIAFAWMAALAFDATHLLTDPDSAMMADETSRAFLAQMAFSLSMAPSGDALAGSLMLKDRFHNTTGKHRVIQQAADGKYYTRRGFEFFQLLLNDPGPFLITILVALATQHQDMVSQFFYLS